MKIKKRNHFAQQINKKGYKVGVEIGVFRGGFSNYLLAASTLTKLYSIDPWSNMDGSANLWLAKKCRRKLKQYGNRSVIIKATSIDAVKTFKDESIDFIYIDGDHSYIATTNDIVNWLPKIKIGGCMSGHDYRNTGRGMSMAYYGEGVINNSRCGVKMAVDRFIKKYKYKLNTFRARDGHGWWFIKDRNKEEL